MTSNVNVRTPPEIYKTATLRMAWIGQNTQKHCLIVQKRGYKSLCQSRIKYF